MGHPSKTCNLNRAGIHLRHLHQLHHDAVHAQRQVQDRHRQAHHLRAGHDSSKEAFIYDVNLSYGFLSPSLSQIFHTVCSLICVVFLPSSFIVKVIYGGLLSAPLVFAYLVRILVPPGSSAEDLLSSTGFCLTMESLGALSTVYRATGSLGIAGIR